MDRAKDETNLLLGAKHRETTRKVIFVYLFYLKLYIYMLQDTTGGIL